MYRMNAVFYGNALNTNIMASLVLLLLISFIKEGTFEGVISSVGKFESSGFLWTHNVSGVTFEAVVSLPLNESTFSELKWTYSSGEEVCSGISTIFSSGIQCGDDNNGQFCYVGCYYKTTNFTILNPLVADSNIQFSSGNINESKHMTIQYCDTLKQEHNSTVIDGGEKASYLNVAVYSCSRLPAAVIVNNDYNNPLVSYNRICEYKTEWTGFGNVVCSYAPVPLLNISPDSSSSLESHHYYMNETILLLCEGDRGYPEFTDALTEYMILHDNGYIETVPSSLKLNSSYNGVNISCKAANEYTMIVDNTTVYIKSNEIGISVRYPPMSPYPDREEIVSMGDNVTIWFCFNSNPQAEKENLKFTFTVDDISTSLSEDIMICTGETEQNCTYKLSNVTRSNFGLYSLEVQSPDSHFQDMSLVMSVYLSDVSFTTSGPDISSSTSAPFPLAAVIGGATAGLLILVVIAVYFMVKFRRNKSSATESAPDKEEKDNPLYGTTARDGGAAVVYAADKTDHASSSKEERLNPLYDSNTGAQGGVEEAYAAVDVRKKKKKNKVDKGNENTAFSPESNAAVYAAVDKSKKKKNDKPPVEAVYSEVNRKKGSKNDTALHGSSQ